MAVEDLVGTGNYCIRIFYAELCFAILREMNVMFLKFTREVEITTPKGFMPTLLVIHYNILRKASEKMS